MVRLLVLISLAFVACPVAADPLDTPVPVTVDRHQIVSLIFESGGLTIRTDGRALEDGTLGGDLRVMNIASRTIVTGTLAADGTVRVAGGRR